ncbi:MAG TPA: GntR family transcriptional regulator [Clostridiales bacterium]|nr:GntR family transcriptional regulator [Clostridiales bacterium]
MVWQFKADRPIYTQLVEQIELRIVSGEYSPGSKLPSVRDLAAEASVNPNTMQKALAELEQNGLLYSQRTSGRYVTEDENMIRKVKDTIALEEIKDFLQKMSKLGFNSQETISLVERIIKEMIPQ